MLRSTLVFFILLAANTGYRPVTTPIDPCDVYGEIFITEDIRKADFRVYIDDSEVYADIVIFKEDNALMADSKGVWFETDNIGFAKHVVFYEKEEAYADFSVHFTDVPAFAGCN